MQEFHKRLTPIGRTSKFAEWPKLFHGTCGVMLGLACCARGTSKELVTSSLRVKSRHGGLVVVWILLIKSLPLPGIR